MPSTNGDATQPSPVDRGDLWLSPKPLGNPVSHQIAVREAGHRYGHGGGCIQRETVSGRYLKTTYFWNLRYDVNGGQLYVVCAGGMEFDMTDNYTSPSVKQDHRRAESSQ